jgi:hypothetical protein
VSTTETLKARDGSTYTAEQAEDGSWSIIDYPVFADGIWHGAKYDAGRVDRLTANTNAAMPTMVPKLGVGHPKEGENETERPAYGRFSALKRKGQFVVSTLSRIPAKLFAAIKAGLYGPPSVRIRVYRNPETGEVGEIVYAVDLLGEVPPEVAPLAAATEFSAPESTCLSWSDWTPFSAVVDGAEAAPTVEAVAQGEPATQAAATTGESPNMSDDTKAREDALAREREELEQQKAALDADRKKFAAARAAEFAAQVKSTFSALLGANKCKPADEETWVNACNAIGAESPGAFSALREAWMCRAEVVPNKGKPANPVGDEDQRADERLFSAVQDVMSKRGIKSYADAAAIVEAEHPDLVEANRKLFACDRAGLSDATKVFTAGKE